MVRKRIELAQNFFKDPQLVASLVQHSSLSEEDVVVEIGPGEGIITKELAKIVLKVIAVERDFALASSLKKQMKEKPNVEVHMADFLQFEIKEASYKIFSNIPFNRTADIVKKILNSKQVREAYLIVQKEAAEKYTGRPRETEVSVLTKPWVASEIIRHFERTDFEPVPSVDVVLLHTRRLDDPLIPEPQAELYRQFVRYGFHATKDNLALSFKKLFTYAQWKRLAKDLKFPLKVTPTALKFEQWVGLFKYFLIGVSEEKKVALGFITKEGFGTKGK
ncbi:MAG TPA: 23S ribosomal RNA methyltransferase Erm [Pyrinomonadaceae bacterium]